MGKLLNQESLKHEATMPFSYVPSKSTPELDPYYFKRKRKRKSATKSGDLVSTFTSNTEPVNETAVGAPKFHVLSKKPVPVNRLPQFEDLDETFTQEAAVDRSLISDNERKVVTAPQPKGFSKTDMLLNLITETKVTRKVQPKIPKSKIRLRMSADRLRLLLRQWSDQIDKAEDDSCDDDAESCTDTDDQTDLEDNENPTSSSRQTSCIDLRAEFSASKKRDTKKQATDVQTENDPQKGSSESTTKSQTGVKQKEPVKGETQDRLMKNILSEHIASMMETSGFTHVKLGALDTVVGLTHNFISDLCKRLKLAKEKELGGIDHGFPDPMERILTHVGYGGVRGLEPEFRSYISSLFDPEDLKLRNPEDSEPTPPEEDSTDPPPVS